MKLRHILSLCSLLMLTQATITHDYSYYPKSSYELKKYIRKARSQEQRRPNMPGCDDAIQLAVAATMASAIGTIVAPGLIPHAALYTAASMLELALAQNIYKSYSIKAPFGFVEDLQKLKKLIDTEKSIFMGGKEYMLAKKFNDFKGTGYLKSNPTLAAACSAENTHTHKLTNQQQYEIYIMPNDSYLVKAFESITKALHDTKEANEIAFVAIRPTPKIDNDAKQILPRIAIVLKQNTDKNTAEKILKIAYNTLKTIAFITPSGYWPRYSEQVTVYDDAWTPVTENLKKMFFIGIGNTDFKSLHTEQFGRKKFLGITKQGDMAYPIKTIAEEKLDTIVIGK